MLDRRIELLRVLDRVGTITEAAHLLYRTPSGYSRQLRSLADELGVKLLAHHGREVRLTEAAQCVVTYADQTHTAWEQTKVALTDDQGAAGWLRLGAHPTALSAIIAPILDQIMSHHPHLEVYLSEAEAPRCFDQLVTNQLDASIVPAGAGVPSVRDRRFHQQKLLTEPIDALIPSRHPLAQHDTLELEQLAEYPWVLPGRDQAGTGEILSACHTAGFTPEAIHHAQDTQALADLVETTGAISLTSRFATYRSPAVRIPLAGRPAPARQLMLCTVTGAETRKPLQTLARLIATEHTPTTPE